ncbi:hypothetical protein [Bacillus xiamenensis]|uniref:hypothetical protein n=1 Tax=Bacillus xiamenensis TaxID=1178537 RepID=UPI000AC4A172|nr:hypothetical protein [Bacillus xiamenensis]
MNKEQKQHAIKLLNEDIEELKKEQSQEEDKGYSRVMKAAIEETIERYKKDIAFLENDLKDEQAKCLPLLF